MSFDQDPDNTWAHAELIRLAPLMNDPKLSPLDRAIHATEERSALRALDMDDEIVCGDIEGWVVVRPLAEIIAEARFEIDKIEIFEKRNREEAERLRTEKAAIESRICGLEQDAEKERERRRTLHRQDKPGRPKGTGKMDADKDAVMAGKQYLSYVEQHHNRNEAAFLMNKEYYFYPDWPADRADMTLAHTYQLKALVKKLDGWAD